MTDKLEQPSTDASLISSMRRRGRKLLDTAGIAQVLVVDDELIPENAEQVAVTLLAASAGKKLTLAGESLGPFSGTDDDDGRDLVSERWKDLAPADRLKAWWNAARASPMAFTDVASLVALIANVEPCPPEEWASREQQLVEEGKARSTLVLFDRDLGTAHPDTGDRLLARWLSNPGARGVILTTNAAGADSEAGEPQRLSEQRLAAEIAEHDDGLAPEQVIVASKDDLGVDGLDRLLHALRIGLSAPELVKLRDQLLKVATDSHQQAVERVVGLDLRALEDIIVRSSRVEGVFEADTLLRALNLHYQHTVQKAVTVKLADLLALVQPVRELAALASLIDHPSSVKVAAELHTIERWHPVATVNAAGHPVASGDVLQLGDGTHWIVCEQSCDLALRDDSVKRRLGSTVPIVPLQADQPSRGQGAWELPEPVPLPPATSEIRWARLGGAEQIPLLTVDLCSFDDEGRSCLDFEAAGAPVPPLTPGLEQLYEEAKARFAERRQEFGDRYLPLTFGLMPDGVDVTIGGTVASFTVQRVGRLAKPYADALLAALNGHRSRAAYEHDLARFRKDY